MVSDWWGTLEGIGWLAIKHFRTILTYPFPASTLELKIFLLLFGVGMLHLYTYWAGPVLQTAAIIVIVLQSEAMHYNS